MLIKVCETSLADCNRYTAAGEVGGGGGAGGVRGATPGAQVVMLMIRCSVTKRFPAHSLSHLFGGCWTS